MPSHPRSPKPLVTPGCFDLWAPRVILFLTLAAPLIFCLDMDDTFDLPKLTLAYAGSLILLALWARQAMTQGVLSIRRTALDLPVIIFLLSAGLSVIGSLEPQLSFFGAYRIYVFGWLPLFCLAMLYALTVQCASTALLERMGTVIRVSASLVGLYAILQYSGHELFDRVPLAVGGRVWSSLGNPIYMGGLCMMALPLALEALLQTPERAVFPTVSRSAALILIVAGLALSLSRGAWVGAAAASAVVLWTRRRVLKERKAMSGLLVGGVLMLAFLPAVRDRAAVLFSAREGSNAARIAGWKGGLQIWREHPWLGSGTDTFFEAFRAHRSKEFIGATGSSVTQADAHNDFIQLAATQGVLGLAAYLGLLLVFFRRLKSVFGVPEQAAYAAALLALWIQNQFNFSSVATSVWAAIFAGLLWGLPIPEGHPENRFKRPVTPPLRLLLTGLVIVCPVGLWAVSLPFRAELAFKSGLAEAGSGHFVYAQTDYAEAIRLNGHVEAYRSELTNTLRELARLAPDEASRQNYLNEAWSAADRATVVHSANPDTWNNRGVAAMWMVQLGHRDDLRDEARRSFERAIQLDPVFVDAWANLARWQHLSGHIDEEKTLWRKVLELDPSHAMALRVLGEAHP